MFPSAYFEDLLEKRRIRKNSKDIINYLSQTLGERTLRRYENLEGAGVYILDYFARYGHIPCAEEYIVDKSRVANIITEIRGFEEPERIILIGAHYDTIEDTPGADDNASAVAGLLELYRLLSPFRFRRTLRFVAFTLEEPPYFSSDAMGSMVHAGKSRRRKDRIDLMICLEMMGYAGKRIPQDFPMAEMKKIYPPYGNYLAVVSLPSSAPYTYLWKSIYNRHSRRKIFEMIGPASIPGMGLSDHHSFVKNGYPAIMLTDTAFYRNKNYHTEGDTFDTINFDFLSDNIMSSFITIREMANMEEWIDGKKD